MSQISGAGMPMGLSEALLIPRTFGPGPTAPTGAPSFTQLLLDSVNQTASLETQAQQAVTGQLTGGDITQVESVLALREADLALKLMVQVRNKVLDAWNELKNMQV